MNALVEQDKTPLLIQTEARTGDVRALAVAVALGSTMGLGIGSAYLAGAAAHQNLPVIANSPASIATMEPRASASERAMPPVISITAVRRRLHADDAAALRLASVGGGRDARCLAQAVYYEARGESPTGQAAVAQVVLNRVHHPAFPKSVCAVVYQRAGGACQFSFACNGAMRETLDEDAWRRARQVAQRAIGGAVMRQVGAATIFQAARVGDSALARSLLQVAHIGAHVFYSLASHGRGSAPPHLASAKAGGARVHVVLAGFMPSAGLATTPADDAQTAPDLSGSVRSGSAEPSSLIAQSS